jgi:hypothetical protein
VSTSFSTSIEDLGIDFILGLPHPMYDEGFFDFLFGITHRQNVIQKQKKLNNPKKEFRILMFLL